MPEMATAAGAQNLGAEHAERTVAVFNSGAGGQGPIETGPSGAGLEFGGGVEERRVAPAAAEDALAFDVEQRTRPRGLVGNTYHSQASSNRSGRFRVAGCVRSSTTAVPVWYAGCGI